MNQENKQLKYGAIISYIAIALNTLTALFYIPWMARKFGKSDYALYNLAFQFVNFFLVDFGLGYAVTRFVSKYRAEHEEKKANTLVGIITKLYLAIDAIAVFVLLIVYFSIDKIYKGLTPQEIVTFKPLFLIVAGYGLFSLPFMSLSGILNAYEKFIQLKLCDLCQRMLIVVLIIAAISTGHGVREAIIANVISGVLFIIIKVAIVRRETPIRPDFQTKDETIFRGVIAFSLWTGVISICQRFIFNLAPTILGIVSNSAEIALFSPANALEGYFYLFAAAVNGLFLARVSRYIADKRDDRIFDLMVKVGRYQLALMGLIFIGFMVVGGDFMSLWMGQDYRGASLCAILMFVPDLLLFTQQIANDTVMAKNEIKHYAYANIGMAIICTALSFPLSGRMGALGASIAIAASYMFTFIYMNVVYYKRLNLDVFAFFRQCYVSFLIPYAITILASFLIIPRISTSGWIGLGIKALIIGSIYVVSVWVLALNKEEKSFITKLILRK